MSVYFLHKQVGSVHHFQKRWPKNCALKHSFRYSFPYICKEYVFCSIMFNLIKEFVTIPKIFLLQHNVFFDIIDRFKCLVPISLIQDYTKTVLVISV